MYFGLVMAKLLKLTKRRFFILGLVLTLLLFLFPPWIYNRGDYLGQCFLLSNRPCGTHPSYISMSVKLLLMEIIIIWLVLGIAYKIAPIENSNSQDRTKDSVN